MVTTARSHVTIVCEGRAHTVRAGTPVGALMPVEQDGEPVVAALVDRRPASLVNELFADGEVEPITTGHWEGARIYRASVALLLLEAAHRLHPELALHVGHSFGYAQSVRVVGPVASLPELAHELGAQMLALVDADLPLVETWWTVEQACANFTAAGWTEAVTLLRTRRHAAVPVVSYGRLFAVRFGPMVARTRGLAGFALVPDESGLLLVHGVIDPTPDDGHASPTLAPAPAETSRATTAARVNIPMLRPHLRWLDALGTTSVGALNRACIDGDVSQLIRVAEGYQEKRIGQIADRIAAHAGVRVVCIAGPSASGKTTFIRRLRVQLQVDGLQPKGISLDDYYADRSAIPRDALGEYDFESFAALRGDLLREHLARLLAGETVRTSRYDFKDGSSDPQGGPELTLGPGDVLLVEGIHGLNPALRAGIDPRAMLGLFVAPLAELPLDRLSQLHSSDLRLLRRIVRDRHERSTDAASTIMRWPSVRDGERRNIFPYQHLADEVFDTSLIYEPCVLRVFAERYLLEVPADHPAFATAYRLLELIEHFVSIYPDHVPPVSILREFIGGSGFDA